MKVLVAGGTGFIGSYLCRALAADGHAVTALSRSPEETPDGVTGVSGDVTDYDSIASAVDGHDAVVNLVALSPLFEPDGGNRMHDRIHRGGTEHLVRAAEAGGVGRFVQLSALGADPNGDTAYIRAKGEAEAIVRESDLDWTIFRPSVVFGEGGEFVSFTKRLKGMFAPGVPLYPLPGGGKTRFQPIHVEDLVPMIAAAVTDDEHAGETYEIGGPEVLTLRQVTDLVYEAEEKGVTIVPLPMPLAKIGLSVLGAVPGFPMGPDQYRSLKFDNTTADNDVGAFGVDPAELTTLGEHLGIR
ncbi:complex I NDUFA9 subunit family protein [Halorubrum sp. SP3]|uniref:complex I NDUFA9 subunit family protein n=1 Tax=Halorubrum sp. SP3 TaxID=1537265 RepID=UPI0010F7AB22|nr:complex I NDUFA9 subunit family protein [Halorubrum sp. SP3]TKX54383.1 complex I NDUFA9 subunit family protein [Halorubrum sp. SP3]